MSPTEESLRAFFGETERGVELLGELDTSRVPRHIAIIMDGNGRWAEQRRLPRLEGHRAGALAVREAIGTAIELGVDVLTIYSFSAENWRRPKAEVAGLMHLFVEVLEREMASLMQRGVRVVVIGRMNELPTKTRKAFESCVTRTADNDGLTLCVALNYGGRQEIADAARDLAADVEAGVLNAADIDEDAFAARLYTAGIADPDLVIRTSGEMRVSNFLLWQIAYSELWVTEVLWPDFDRTTLLEGVVVYGHRARRFGGSA